MIMRDCKDKYDVTEKDSNHTMFISALWQVSILVVWFYAFYIIAH